MALGLVYHLTRHRRTPPPRSRRLGMEYAPPPTLLYSVCLSLAYDCLSIVGPVSCLPLRNSVLLVAYKTTPLDTLPECGERGKSTWNFVYKIVPRTLHEKKNGYLLKSLPQRRAYSWHVRHTVVCCLGGITINIVCCRFLTDARVQAWACAICTYQPIFGR